MQNDNNSNNNESTNNDKEAQYARDWVPSDKRAHSGSSSPLSTSESPLFFDTNSIHGRESLGHQQQEERETTIKQEETQESVSVELVKVLPPPEQATNNETAQEAEDNYCDSSLSEEGWEEIDEAVRQCVGFVNLTGELPKFVPLRPNILDRMRRADGKIWLSLLLTREWGYNFVDKSLTPMIEAKCKEEYNKLSYKQKKLLWGVRGSNLPSDEYWKGTDRVSAAQADLIGSGIPTKQQTPKRKRASQTAHEPARKKEAPRPHPGLLPVSANSKSASRQVDGLATKDLQVSEKTTFWLTSGVHPSMLQPTNLLDNSKLGAQLMKMLEYGFKSLRLDQPEDQVLDLTIDSAADPSSSDSSSVPMEESQSTTSIDTKQGTFLPGIDFGPSEDLLPETRLPGIISVLPNSPSSSLARYYQHIEREVSRLQQLVKNNQHHNETYDDNSTLAHQALQHWQYELQGRQLDLRAITLIQQRLTLDPHYGMQDIARYFDASWQAGEFAALVAEWFRNDHQNTAFVLRRRRQEELQRLHHDKILHFQIKDQVLNWRTLYNVSQDDDDLEVHFKRLAVGDYIDYLCALHNMRADPNSYASHRPGNQGLPASGLKPSPTVASLYPQDTNNTQFQQNHLKKRHTWKQWDDGYPDMPVRRSSRVENLNRDMEMKASALQASPVKPSPERNATIDWDNTVMEWWELKTWERMKWFWQERKKMESSASHAYRLTRKTRALADFMLQGRSNKEERLCARKIHFYKSKGPMLVKGVFQRHEHDDQMQGFDKIVLDYRLPEMDDLSDAYRQASPFPQFAPEPVPVARMPPRDPQPLPPTEADMHAILEATEGTSANADCLRLMMNRADTRNLSSKSQNKQKTKAKPADDRKPAAK